MTINRNLDQDLEQLGIQRRFSSPQPVPTGRLQLDRFTNPLDGSPEMAIDGSVTPVSFRASVPPNLNALLLQAHFFLCDTGMRPSRFGGLMELTNGCKLSFRDAGDDALPLGGTLAASAISDGTTYKTNAQWITACGTNLVFWDGGANDDLLAFDFPFHELGISIQLRENEYMEMLIRDNLTEIDSFQGSVITRLIGT